MHATVKGNQLTLTIELAAEPYVSNSEAIKAEKDKRQPQATMLASSGGFTRLIVGDKSLRVSFNVLKG